MKLLTKNTDYAVRALLQCALDKRRLYHSSAEISQAQSIPLRFLRVLLQKLIKGGFLESREGKGGGVRLARAAGKISVLDVLRLLQGEVQVSECLFRKRLCPNRANCVLRHKMLEIEGKLAAELAHITIGGLPSDLRSGTK